MLLQRLIPSLLLKGQRLVKGQQFNSYKDAGNPKTVVRAHNYQGADEIFLADIESSKKNIPPNFEIIREVAEECFIPLTVAGGIKNISIARECMNSGADKLCLNMAAFDRPEIITELSELYGKQSIVLGVDVFRDKDNQYYLYDHRVNAIKKEIALFDWIEYAISLGVGELKIMHVINEGSLKGYDFNLYKLIKQRVRIPIIFEGGAGSLLDLEQAFNQGISGVALGSMLVFTDANIVKIKSFMKSQKIRVRY